VIKYSLFFFLFFHILTTFCTPKNAGRTQLSDGLKWAGFGQSQLFAVISTQERFCHIIRKFVDYLLDLRHLTLCAISWMTTRHALPWPRPSRFQAFFLSGTSSHQLVQLLVRSVSLVMWIAVTQNRLFFGTSSSRTHYHLMEYSASFFQYPCVCSDMEWPLHIVTMLRGTYIKDKMFKILSWNDNLGS
jgi:hypothetical protein